MAGKVGTRSFGGKLYKQHDFASTKSKAQGIARSARARGKSARVVKVGKGARSAHVVYIR